MLWMAILAAGVSLAVAIRLDGWQDEPMPAPDAFFVGLVGGLIAGVLMGMR